MSVAAVVKPKGPFGKQLALKDILTEELAYGIYDEYCRLVPDECDESGTIIFARDYFARGIAVRFEGKNVEFKLPLPNCLREIELFYMLIAGTCKLLGTEVFYREDEKTDLSRVEQFIQSDVSLNKAVLKNMERELLEGSSKSFITFGVMHPISIGLDEVKEIGSDMDKFADFLNRKQQLDAYYAVPHFYQKDDGTIFGAYAIRADTRSIVPTEPKVPFTMQKKIQANSWYVYLGNSEGVSEGGAKTVAYEDFIGFLKNTIPYDYDHVVITLSDDEVNELGELYGVKV